MKTIKVAEATELQLDWLAAKCEALPVAIHNTGAIYLIDTPWADKSRVKWLAEFGPTRHWAQGGPIKERQGIASGPQPFGGFWAGKGPIGDETVIGEYGSTELQAVLRCYVASKLGDTAEVPEELM